LGSIYQSFDAPEYQRDKELLRERSALLLDLVAQSIPKDPEQGARRIGELLRAYEDAGDLAENLDAYAQAVYTTDTRDPRALAEINAIEALSLPLGKGAVLFRSRLAEREDLVLRLIETEADLRPYGNP
jgi:oligoendopeptidase F